MGEKEGGVTYRTAEATSSAVPLTRIICPGSLVMGWGTTSLLTTIRGIPMTITAQTDAVTMRLMAIWLGMR